FVLMFAAFISRLLLFCLFSFFFFFFFFFSSRRRHTRCYRDWSSDVCSSDLKSPAIDVKVAGAKLEWFRRHASQVSGPMSWVASRSEERRVGKECRVRRWT